ncbi:MULTISPECIES: tyrosine-type recombinase/integrase [Bacillales]|uniref:tyrosine-type recombinase/integrase n=1 Tax=Bacillales TaxID=1385 RepID=UPI00190E3A99|nr:MULTISPECIES: tyrosine-type recombinase/integrase [Bacillales]WAI29752.1 MAG: tyrosine-type recombinase/integrase [Bacillus paranthracis]MBK3313194.1 tyrosine-type recombinase/integrase [Staphylococcus aureus]MDA2666434.1 tyrosine-type recombinase/integrase [Bacillus cereus group sp. Bc032]MDA2675883.1 tyrosine-type recombinase/integrase [Bacillus cereus group sp. Bc031]MDA2681351.1 tyrosine-type recombinase/integrase [Bacillus cereus group sp. Bc029]
MNIINYEHNNQIVKSKSDFFDSSHFENIMGLGIRNIDYSQLSEESLVYLFLHDEPSLTKNRSERTKQQYLHDLSHFLRYIKEAIGTIQELSHNDMEIYFYELSKKYAATTLRKKKTVVQQFLKYVYDNNGLSDNFSSRLKKVSVKKEELVNRDLYPEEVTQILDELKKSNYFVYTAFFLLTTTGLRIEEIATAKWANLVFHSSLNAYLLRVVGKGNKSREVRIFEDTLDALCHVRSLRKQTTKLDASNTSAFLPKADGSNYRADYLSSLVAKKIEETNLTFLRYRQDRITPHTCRHFMANYLMEKGIELKKIRDYLGHESIMTTERYLRERTRRQNLATIDIGNSLF